MKNKLSKFAWFNLGILICFTAYFLVKLNFEFLIYAVSISVFIYILEKTDRIFKYTQLAKAGFTAWLFLHLLGGTLYLKGFRLYDTILINLAGEPYNILKYDQAIHVFCYFVMTMFLHSIVMHISEKNAGKITIGFITTLAALGLSAVNEIIEFSAVVFFNSDGVGGYYNNALDLVFNLIGILIAIAVLRNNKKQKI